MIESPARTKGETTRQKCLVGVQGLLAQFHRDLEKCQRDQLTRTLGLEIHSASGVMSATRFSSRIPKQDTGNANVDDLIGEILDELPSLALPECHKTIRIEVVSVNGALSVVDTDTVYFRWDR